MDASRDGIQKLMTAEKEAQAIVSAAREGAWAMATRMWVAWALARAWGLTSVCSMRFSRRENGAIATGC